MSNISKSFGNKLVIDNLSMKIKQNGITGFLGPSGAGKTTTIKILTGQIKQDQGSALILNRETHTLNNEIYSQIGIVTDNSGLYDRFTAYDNMLLFARIYGVEKNRIHELLERVGLQNHAKQKVKTFSKGMKQRLLIARAIIHKPKLLFLDEPTNGLDPITALEIYKLLLNMKEEGTAIFLTTHNMHEAEKLCDYIVLIAKGKLIEEGTLSELKEKHNKSKNFNIASKSQELREFESSSKNNKTLINLTQDNEAEAINYQEPTLEKIFLSANEKETK